MANKVDCPHCNVPFPPRWQAAAVQALNPEREEVEGYGTMWTTSCTSCDRPVLEFEPVAGAALGESVERQTVFPPSNDIAIEVVVQIMLDFSDYKREEGNDPPMSSEEREEQATVLREGLKGMRDVTSSKETFRKAGEALKTVGSYAPAVTKLLEVLGV